MKKKGRDRSVGRPSVIDLQMMFLKAIGDEAPEAAQDLFLIADAAQWAHKYHASVQWLIDFASSALRVNWQVVCLPSEYRRRIALDAWRLAVARWRSIVATLDFAAVKVDVDFDVETLDKRSAEAHCRWLAMWLFVKGMTDEQIQERENIDELASIARGRGAMARVLGFDLPKRRGRPRKS